MSGRNMTLTRLHPETAPENSLLRRMHARCVAEYEVSASISVYGRFIADGGVAMVFVDPDGAALGLVCDRPSAFIRGEEGASPDEGVFEPGSFDPNADRIDVKLVVTL